MVAEGVSAPGTMRARPAYMSPEQASGGEVDSRSDIFSFGTMLYEMASGARPFGERPSPIRWLPSFTAAQAADRAVPGLPRELERLILRCLRKEPDRRYQTIRDVSLELQEIKEESDSGRLSASASAPDLPRRARLIPAVVVAAAAVVAVIAIAWWLKQKFQLKAPVDGSRPDDTQTASSLNRPSHRTASKWRSSGAERSRTTMTSTSNWWVERTTAPHDG